MCEYVCRGTMNVQAQPQLSAEAVRLSDYIASALERNLPAAVATKTKQHILDTLAAILSGSRLRAGKLAAGYVERIGGAQEASVVGTPVLAPVEYAALANGMAAHADETDDSHLGGWFHPGCGIVPAALAVAEQRGSSGFDLIRAVALGYDIGARVNMALGLRPGGTRHSTHSLGTSFGAAAAAAALMKFDARRGRYVLSYAAQQASGIPYWHRDTEHVEKAFDFGGMGARNGVAAAMMVAAGLSAVEDPFSGAQNFFMALGENPDPARLVADLGTRFEIMQASIKKWCVGSPIQSVLDAMTALIEAHGIKADDTRRIVITMPDDRIHITDNRDMPDVCVQHMAAVALLDGGITFESAHDHDRMSDAAVRAMRNRIELVPSPELSKAVPARQAIVEIETNGGNRVRHHAKAVRGTPDNPMTAEEIETKALDLVAPVIGAMRGKDLVSAIAQLETKRSMRELRLLLQA